MPDQLRDDLGIAIWDMDDTIAGLLGRFHLRQYRPDHASFILWATAEQAPNPDSRVTLGSEVDAFGMPRIEVDWQLTELDKRSVRQMHELLAAELGRSGLGRLQIEAWLTADNTSWSEDIFGGAHHMGTTRMSGLPADGVVDRNARVHGMANLFIAGSSVFPTSGSANPTLTIVALSLRLADHLEQVMVSKA
jgi:choline dehydrogenase-like flavoprotein